MAGGDLFERVAAPEYKLTEEKVQIFMKQIIRGLQYIHQLNIVHLGTAQLSAKTESLH